jgi:hypothetical protein
MSKTKETKKKLQTKIESVKKIIDDSAKKIENVGDAFQKNIPDPNQFLGEQLSGLLDKKKRKIDNKKDTFAELIEVAEQFITTNKKTVNDKLNNISFSNPNRRGVNVNIDKNPSKSKIKRHGISAANVTIGQSKEIVINRLSEALFMGDGICGSKSVFNVDSIQLSPDEFDFLNIFTLDPDSTCGQLVYELKSPDKNKEKLNRNLYDLMANGGTHTYTSNNGNDLFTASWNAGTQKFTFSGFTRGTAGVVNVQDFITDYYNSLEYSDINDIVKQCMLFTINGGASCSESKKFTKSLNESLRLIDKLLKTCGGTNRDLLKNQTPVDMFNENDEDLEFYFDFDNVEGIDLDNEDARNRAVLKFKSCNDYEIPVSDMHIEDFVFLSRDKNIQDSVNQTLENVARDASEQSGGSLSINVLLDALLNNFILYIPKVLVMSIISAKIFLPLIILYKIFKTMAVNVYLNAKELIKKFKKAITKIVSDLFWLFIREFWRLVKIDLLAFVNEAVQRILKNKYKRYLLIITSLIALLKKILESEIDNCYAIFQTILTTIENALSQRLSVSVPSLLLLFSDRLPGYSQDRAFMNIMNRLESSGIPTGPLFGESNDIGNLVKSIIDGHTEEEDSNSFIKIVLQGGTLPGPPVVGGAIIPPGVISGVGKKF